MDYSHLKLFFSKILRVWGESYYTKPLLEIVSLFCIVSIAKARRNLEVRKVALFFCISVFLLFVIVDLSFGTYYLVKPLFSFDDFVQYNETLNGLFTFIEFYTIYRIANFGIDSPRLKLIGKLVGLFLLLKELVFRFEIIRVHNIGSVQFFDELSSGASYAILTLYFTYYHITLYKLNIMSTLVTPSAYMIFCYVVLSLLFFPCSYYFISQNSNVGYVIYAYHTLLAIGICLVFRYNVLKHYSKDVNFMRFDV